MIFYFLFQTTHLAHEIIESFGSEKDESSTHHGPKSGQSLVSLFLFLRIAVYVVFLLKVMPRVPLVAEFKPIARWFLSKMSEAHHEEEEESDEEELFSKKVPKKEVSLTTEEDDHDFDASTILYFSIKLLIVYELLLQLGSLWMIYIVSHFGILQHLIVFVIIFSLTLTAVPAFL